MNLLNLLPIIGRCFIGIYFAAIGFWNIYHWRPLLRVLISKNIPLPFIILPLGIFWEIVAGAMIIFDSYVKLAALSLIFFTVIAITIYHDFWNHEGELRRLNMIVFLANLTISFGALLLLLNNVTALSSFADLFT